MKKIQLSSSSIPKINKYSYFITKITSFQYFKKGIEA